MKCKRANERPGLFADEIELSALMGLSQGVDSESYQLLLMKVRNMLTRYVQNSFNRISAVGSQTESVEALLTLDFYADLDLEALCEQLPEKQKIVLRLVKIQGLSIIEASKMTGFSASDIKVTVHRAIKNLKALALPDAQPEAKDGFDEY